VLTSLRETLEALIESDQRNLSPIPDFIWHGLNNQFHHWIVNSFSLKFGLSVVDGQPASRKIWLALRWTLIINILSIAIGYLLAILTGVYAGWWGGAFDRMMSLILYFIYSIPVFWLTTILVVFFTTTEYGSWTNIFPAAGIIRAEASDPFLKVISRNAGQLIIPVLVLGTSLMAYIARIVRNSVAEERYKSYVTHARTKGLTEHYILWKHVFRNASFPLITLLASVLPASLAGSLVVEVICNLPGSGRLLYDAVIDHDWPVVNGVIMISALLTILGLLISDILYRVADPRIKWQ
jgi:peptide/nickel transport system permease protein